MNDHKNSHLVFSLSLLLIFVIGSFFVLLFETKGYSKLQDTINEQESLYMPLSYIQTKCRMNDDISIETREHIDCLVFNQKEMKTYLYYQEGKLKELYATAEYKGSLSQGQDLFEIDDMKIEVSKTLFIITIKKGSIEKQLNIYTTRGDH